MYAVIDVETTGGSPATDRLIEIAVLVCDGDKVSETFSTLINPKRPIDPYVTKLTGITNEMVHGAPEFEEVHQRVLELTNENIFVAHNVKFDFGILRKEFKRLGIDFNRKQLDTVNLARKIFPGFNSYSLGNICDSLGIPVLDRHRAYGDAEATVRLLQQMLSNHAHQKFFEIELNHGIDVDLLPPYLSKAEIEKLPEDAGVFYYKDELGKVLYLDGTKNIRRKVVYELTRPAETPAKKRMLELLRNIDYELCGSELVAKLLSYREVKKHLPEFNKKPSTKQYNYGIFFEKDEEGYFIFKARELEWTGGELVLKIASKASANKVLGRIINENHLQRWFALRNKMKETGGDEHTILTYNQAMEKAQRRYLFRHPNFFIVGEGIHPDEHSVVWVEKNTYKGFGYFNPELTEASPDNLREVIRPDEDDTETQKIIRTQLRRMKNAKFVTY